MKTGPLLLVAVALVLAAAGGAYVYLLGDAEPAPSAAKPAAALEGIAPAKPVEEPAELARLKQENALLKEQLDNMRVELNAKERAQAAALREQEAASAADNDADIAMEAEDAGEEDDRDRGERRGRNRNGGWNEERSAEFRAGIDQFYDEAIAATTAPEAQERLALLQDYTNQMMDLRQQMRTTEDPAARQALEDEVDALRDEMRPIMRDQQDQMLRDAAANSGVTDPKTQAQLIEAFRDTIRSPFFMQDRGFGRGGGGGGGNGQGNAPKTPKAEKKLN